MMAKQWLQCDGCTVCNSMRLQQVFTPDPECAVRHRLYGTFKVSD